jgi:hypothetical protein
MSKAMQVASEFMESVRSNGFQVSRCEGEVVSIFRKFAPGDRDAFVACDMLGPDVLGRLGARGGSMWGTDGGSIGGASGLRDGYYRLNVSGVPKRVVVAVMRLVG